MQAQSPLEGDDVGMPCVTFIKGITSVFPHDVSSVQG